MCCLHICPLDLIAHSKIILYKSKQKSLQSKYKFIINLIHKQTRKKTMCYQVDVILEDNQAIITVGESKFIAYHDTEANVKKAR